MNAELPGQLKPIDPAEPFHFLCHQRIACFTDCCRELELALTPYDVLRLRRATGIHSATLHDTCIIEEQDDHSPFPSFYLSMVDDGRASCVFVRPEGCSIYAHRPGACRAYPVGRGTAKADGRLQERFVLLQEPHCRGFQQNTLQTVQGYMKSQELEPYNRFNDLLVEITQHHKIKSGMRPNAGQIRLYRLALYDLDSFREGLTNGELNLSMELPPGLDDDEVLLSFALTWLKNELFGQSS